MAKVKSNGHIWGLEFNKYGFFFCFMAIWPFLAEIQQIPYLTLESLGQGHGKNWPKSNQVIYRSGPSILPKMKESEKVFRSYRMSKSLRLAAYRLVQKH